jgi:hypothetical protein
MGFARMMDASPDHASGAGGSSMTGGGGHASCGSPRCAFITQAFDLLYRDVKREDALCVVSWLSRRGQPERGVNVAPVGIRSRGVGVT